MAHAQLAAGGDADVGRGAADVERDDVVEARHPARPDAADEARDRAGHEQVDGPLRRRLHRRHAARGLHQLHAVAEARLAHRVVEARHVARHLRPDVGVEGDGREALELAVQRQHLVRDREVGLRELLEQDLLHALLVRRVQVAVQEADRDGFDARGLELADALAHLVLVERDEHLAVRHRHALLHRQPVAALDERPRLPGQLLLEREVERLLVTGDVEDVAHALRRDHPDLGSRVGERDVRRDRRAVQEVVDLGEVDVRLLAQAADAVDDAAGRVVGGGGDLVDGDPARLLVDEGQVGERAADVDSDALHPSLFLLRLSWSRRRR